MASGATDGVFVVGHLSFLIGQWDTASMTNDEWQMTNDQSSPRFAITAALCRGDLSEGGGEERGEKREERTGGRSRRAGRAGTAEPRGGKSEVRGVGGLERCREYGSRCVCRQKLREAAESFARNSPLDSS